MAVMTQTGPLDGMPVELARFAEWVVEQPAAVRLRALACLSVVRDGIGGTLTIGVICGVPLPNLWAMVWAAENLRDLAQAARMFEEMRCDTIEQMAEVVRLVESISEEWRA